MCLRFTASYIYGEYSVAMAWKNVPGWHVILKTGGQMLQYWLHRVSWLLSAIKRVSALQSRLPDVCCEDSTWWPWGTSEAILTATEKLPEPPRRWRAPVFDHQCALAWRNHRWDVLLLQQKRHQEKMCCRELKWEKVFPPHPSNVCERLLSSGE